MINARRLARLAHSLAGSPPPGAQTILASSTLNTISEPFVRQCSDKNILTHVTLNRNLLRPSLCVSSPASSAAKQLTTHWRRSEAYFPVFVGSPDITEAFHSLHSGPQGLTTNNHPITAGLWWWWAQADNRRPRVGGSDNKDNADSLWWLQRLSASLSLFLNLNLLSNIFFFFAK